MKLSEIARMVKESPAQVADDMEHLLRSLKHTDYRVVVEPAKCRSCGFVFAESKLKKPSKCPECQSTWLTEPRVAIELKSGDSQS